MTLDEASKAVWNGNAIAFLGSGFSKGAQNMRGENLRTSEELRLHLTTASSGPVDGDLGDAAEAYRTAFGGLGLIQELVNEFSAKGVAEHHKEIASVPWRRVYTTNYDNVFEVSAKEVKTKVIPITLKIDPFAARQDALQYVHLNGAIEGLTEPDLDTILKLTDTSYVTSSVAESPWAITFCNDLRLAEVVFYFGYSLFDLDIKRIIFESLELSRKSFFILGENPTALTRQRIQKFGTLVESSVGAFAPRLQAAKPPAGLPKPITFESLLPINPDESNRPARDNDVFDLFELGTFQRQLIHQSIAAHGDYYLHRDVPSRVFECLDRGLPAVVLVGSLGNGKTLALEGVAYEGIAKGYKVFMANEPGSKSSLEFEYVAKLDSPTLLLVDDYSAWLRDIRCYGLARKPHSKLVLAARDVTHDVLYEASSGF